MSRGVEFALAACAAAVGLWVAGCERREDGVVGLPSGGARAAAASPGLVPSYRGAVYLYRAGDRARARDALVGLLGQPGLSAESAAFFRRQVAICEGGKGEQMGGRAQPGPRRAEVKDCGPRALRILLERMGKRADLGMLTRHSGTNRFGTTLAGLERAAKAEGLRAQAVQMDLAALKRIAGPGIAWVDGEHYVAVWRVDGEEAVIRDPNQSRDERIATEELLRRSGGIVLTLAAE